MTRRPATNKEVLLVKQIIEGGSPIDSENLPPSLKGQAKPGGESIAQTALREATAEQVERAREIIGSDQIKSYESMYESTKNPVWIWLIIGLVKNPADLPLSAVKYIQQVGSKFFHAVVAQVTALDPVEITTGLSAQEAIQQGTKIHSPLPDVAQMLGLATVGRNPFRAAARSLRDISYAVAFEHNVRKGLRHEDVYALMAVCTGKASAECGPGVEGVRKSVARGRKLLPPRPGKPKS